MVFQYYYNDYIVQNKIVEIKFEKLQIRKNTDFFSEGTPIVGRKVERPHIFVCSGIARVFLITINMLLIACCFYFHYKISMVYGQVPIRSSSSNSIPDLSMMYSLQPFLVSQFLEYTFLIMKICHQKFCKQTRNCFVH